MKQKFWNLTLFNIFQAVLFLFFHQIACQDPHTRTIYDFYTDEHEKGKFQGYCYYLNPSISAQEKNPLQLLTLKESGLMIGDSPSIFILPSSFNFICDYEENLPCSVVQFKKMFARYHKEFTKNIDLLINYTNILDSGDQCMILHSTNRTSLTPHLICLYIPEQVVNLKFAIRNAYIAFLRKSSFDVVSDTVQIGENFDLEYAYDPFFVYTANAVIKETELILYSPENKTIIIPYNEISHPVTNVNCNITYQRDNKNLTLPIVLRQDVKDDPYCCFSFNYTEKQWFLCSVKVSDCITPIRRLGLYMMQSCNHYFNLSQNPHSHLMNSPNYKAYLYDPENGLWGGWGYVTYLSVINSYAKIPVYLKVDQNNFSISTSETELPEKSIEIMSLKWLCGSYEICSPEEYRKYALDSDTIEDIMKNVGSFIENLDIHYTSCGIFQDFSNRELMICIHNPSQYDNFKSTMIKNYNEKLKGASQLLPLPDNAILPMVVTDGNMYFIEPVQFQTNQAKLFRRPDSLPIVVYMDLDSINGETCQILLRDINIPKKILSKKIDQDGNYVRGECCLTYKYSSRMIYMCSLSDKCDKIIERVAKKIQMRCEKMRNPNDLESGPEIDFHSGIIDKHQKGYWAGYVTYSRLGLPIPKKPVYVEVDVSQKTISVRSYKQSTEILQIYEILNLEWVCQSELPCSPEEYISKKNDPKVKRSLDRIYLEKNIGSSTHCSLIEARSTTFYFSQKVVGLFCPTDLPQGLNFKLAIKAAYDSLIEQTDINDIPFAPEGSEFMISFYNENSPTNITVFKARLSPTEIEKLPDEYTILSYKDMKEISNVKCGLEFRNLTLPNDLKVLNINPQCCFSVMKNKDRIYICVRSQIRCITQSRMMMKRIKEDCMTLMSINKEVSSAELENISEQFELADHVPNVFGPPKSNDPLLKFDLEKNLWEGMIYFSQLDKEDQIEIQEKFLKLAGNYLNITEKPTSMNELLKTKSYHINAIYFACNSPDLCHPSNYINQMEKVRSNYEIQVLKKAIDNFMIKLPEVNKESNCLILEFEDFYFHAIKPYIVCTKDLNQGFFLRKIISCRYNEQMENLDYLSEDSNNIPFITIKDRFPLKFYEENSEEVSPYVTHMDENSIQRDSTDFVFLRFQEIDNCTLLSPIQNRKLFERILSDNVDPKCCFEISKFGKPFVVCSIDGFRCSRSKIMIMKYAQFYCAKKILSSEGTFDKENKPLYFDDFRFEIPRLSNTIISSDTDLSQFKDDFIDDSDNGVWKGWIFANTLTDREGAPNFMAQAFYLEINRNFITYKTKVQGGDLAFMKPTMQLKIVCEDSIGPCSPTKYLEFYSHDTNEQSFLSRFQLKEGILEFIDQMPNIDEQGCVIVEFSEPKCRTRISEIVCAIFPEDGDSLRIAFGNAYYLSLLRAELDKDIEAVSYLSETFTVKIWEEKRLMSDIALFNETGIINQNNILLYKYSDIADDKVGSRCAFWYKYIKLPVEFGDQDPNCCFTFSLKNGKNVYICANYPIRCIRSGRRILLKMKLGCLSKNRDHMENPYENKNTVSPFQEIDNYFKVLYDDSPNGIWRGLVFHHKLGSDESISENPNFMKIENGYVYFYPNENIKNIEGVEIEAKEKLIMRNMYFTCNQQYTCDITNYINYFSETISEDVYDLTKLKEDIHKVTDKLPVEDSTNTKKDDCCTIISFKDENDVKENHIICTRISEQGLKIKKALTKSLNNIIINSNIKREIPLAASQDDFQIQYYDALNNIVQEATVRFGKYYLYDKNDGHVILKYTQLKSDSYGTKCAIWNTQLSLPNQMTIEAKECCFMVNLNDMSYYICSSGDYHCLKKARIMMKTIKEGCLAGGLDLNGDFKIEVPEVREPNTEILGQKIRGPNTGKSEGSSYFNFTHELNENIVFSKKNNAYYKSWMIEFILPNNPLEELSPREVYVEISSQHLKVYQEVNQYQIEIFNLTNINWVCYKEHTCLPSELMNYYRYLKDSTFDYTLLEAAYSKIVAYIPNEKQCLALDFYNFSSASSDKRVFCIATYDENIIEILQNSVVNAYHEAVKKIDFDHIKLALEYQDIFFIEYLAPGSNEVQSMQVVFGEMGIEFEKETVLLYQSPDNCDICYNLHEKEIQNIHTNLTCCLKIKKNGFPSYICDLNAYRCDMEIKQIAKYLYLKCIDLNKNALQVDKPQNCIYESKTQLKYMPELNKMKNDMNVGNLLENYAEENINSIKKSNDLQEEIEKHLLRVNQEISRLKKEVIKSEKNEGDIINYNSDGSTSVIKPNGTQIIEDMNNAVKVIIRTDNTIEIIYFDGADYIIHKNGENVFHLPNNMIIKINKGYYEVQSPDLYFKLQSNGSAYLHENVGKTTYIESDSKCTTVLNDGTKIMKKSNGLTEIDNHGSISLIKTPEI